MSKQSKRLNKDAGARLGPILKRSRIEQGIPAAQLARDTGLSRSYLSYLETGRFAEVGLDKLVRLLLALDLSADRVLQEAGYLPQTPQDLPEPKIYLRTQYQLSPAALEQAQAFLEFLQQRERTKVRAKK